MTIEESTVNNLPHAATPADPIFDAEESCALARFDLEKNNLEGAVRKLKPLLTGQEPPSEALALGARVYAQLRMVDRAKDLLEQYLVRHPEAFDEMFQLGMLHFDSGTPKEALGVWARLLKAMPTYPPALFFSGLALANDNKISDARRSLDILLQSATADNLYYNKAKELLQAIDSAAAQRAAEVQPASPISHAYEGGP